MKKIVVSQQKAVLAEAERPTLDNPRRVIVKVHYSSISPGTELGLIRNPAIPDGFHLGYSASGEVVEVGSAVTKVKEGDFVACYGGPYVYHAEMLSVPEQLCVRLDGPERLREAAFVGLASVGIHSVRRMNRQFGETVWVVGLGLLGLMIAQLCEACNYNVIATDMNPDRCELARKCGVPQSYRADDPELNAIMNAVTEGAGFDAIALCAHSSNPNLIEQCMEKLAFRGTFEVVGNVPVQVSRELFFQKEADLVIARAAGPGRYDARYEDEGIDYPRSYVRWTEGRNMQEYVRLIQKGALKLRSAITHEYAIEDAPAAYEALEKNPGAALGVLIRY